MPKAVLIDPSAFASLEPDERIFAQAGGEFVFSPCESADEIIAAAHDADILMVVYRNFISRSILEHLPNCKAVVRHGIGVDNIDVEAATDLGILVINNPTYCIEEVSDMAIALLLACTRRIPLLDRVVRTGTWQNALARPGYRVCGSTLGLVGLGRIAQRVAEKARGFGMRLLAYDPYVSEDRAKQMGVELCTLDTIIAESDFLTVHLPKTPDTLGLINRDLLLKAKPTLRVINVARGGIVDEADLAECVREGVIAGAALDVFDVEPTTESPLFELDSVVVTPHLGASTREAQDKAGDTIASMVQLALDGEFVPFAVNVNAAEANETLRPFLPLAERLGGLFVSLVGGLPTELEICTEGEIAGYDTRILELAALKGFFGGISDEAVTYVNAPQLAKDHGVDVREVSTATATDYVNLLTLRGGGHSISGTLSGHRGEQRIVNIDDVPFDVPPVDHMVIISNDDRPGVIGTVGTMLGNAGVNIADMDVSRVEGSDTAVMLIAPTEGVPAQLLDDLRVAPGILSVTALSV